MMEEAGRELDYPINDVLAEGREYYDFDSPETCVTFVQIGDFVQFVPSAYEAFVKDSWRVLNFESDDVIWPTDHIPGMKDAKDGYPCVVKSI